MNRENKMEAIKKGFSIGEAVKFGWNTARRHLPFLLGFMLAVWILETSPSLIQTYFEPVSPLIAILTKVLALIISLLVSMAFVKIALKLSDDQPARFVDLFNTFPLIPKFLAASILYLLILAGGFVLFVFPMVIWGIRYSLFPYFIVDKGVGPIEALSLSAKATEGAKWDLLGLFFVLITINVLGALCLLIGLFITAPTTWIAHASVYRYLVKQTAQAPIPE